MDGCLLDTERGYMRAWQTAFTEKGFSVDWETLETWAGLGSVRINARAAEILGDPSAVQPLRDLRNKHFMAALERGEIRPMPGAGEILDYLAARGAVIGLATSSSRDKAMMLLQRFDLFKYFDVAVFADDIEHLKPAPDIYLRAQTLSGRTKEECLAFEDSASGVAAAYNAGIDVVYAPDIGVPAAAEIPVFARIDSLTEGIGLLEKVLA